MKIIKKISLILAMALIIAGSATLMACGNKRLATPQNIILDLTEKKVTFDKVENADRYFVSIYIAVDGGSDVLFINSLQVLTNEATFTQTVSKWGDYYAEVYAAASDNVAHPPSETGKSTKVAYSAAHSNPQFRVVKSVRESSSQTGPGGTNTVKIQLNPAQFDNIYKATQVVPASFEFKVYSGTAATGTPLLTKTITGNSLSTAQAESTINATGFTFDITSALADLGNYRMTLQAIAGTVGMSSAVYEYTYNYTAHGTSVTNTNAGTYTAVTGYTFLD